MSFIPEIRLPYGLAEQLVKMREAEPSNYSAIANGVKNIAVSGQEAYTKYNTDNPKTNNLSAVMQTMYPQQNTLAQGQRGGALQPSEDFNSQMKSHDFSTQYGMPEDLFSSIKWH